MKGLHFEFENFPNEWLLEIGSTDLQSQYNRFNFKPKFATISTAAFHTKTVGHLSSVFQLAEFVSNG